MKFLEFWSKFYYLSEKKTKTTKNEIISSFYNFIKKKHLKFKIFFFCFNRIELAIKLNSLKN